MRRSMSCMARLLRRRRGRRRPERDLYHAPGPNGGGAMRGDSVAAMWPTLEIIRDIYTQASQGVVLKWVSLWDAAVAFRPEAYARTAFRHGA